MQMPDIGKGKPTIAALDRRAFLQGIRAGGRLGQSSKDLGGERRFRTRIPQD